MGRQGARRTALFVDFFALASHSRARTAAWIATDDAVTLPATDSMTDAAVRDPPGWPNVADGIFHHARRRPGASRDRRRRAHAMLIAHCRASLAPDKIPKSAAQRDGPGA
jgi:hypothetical protein